MLDLSKLTPAPWEVHDGGRSDHTVCQRVGEGCKPLFERWDGTNDLTDAEFIALARNAFDVMMRRGWTPRKEERGWVAADAKTGLCPQSFPGFFQAADDPFTALVEADKWYKEQGI